MASSGDFIQLVRDTKMHIHEKGGKGGASTDLVPVNIIRAQIKQKKTDESAWALGRAAVTVRSKFGREEEGDMERVGDEGVSVEGDAIENDGDRNWKGPGVGVGGGRGLRG